MDFPEDIGGGRAVVQVTGTNCWLASSNQSSIPGCYASREAAIYAFSLPDEELLRLQALVNERETDPNKRVITLAMLNGLP
jgi:hypothetical protein